MIELAVELVNIVEENHSKSVRHSRVQVDL